jgi:hypothetical protein
MAPNLSNGSRASVVFDDSTFRKPGFGPAEPVIRLLRFKVKQIF